MAARTKEELVEVTLPILRDANAPQEEFFSLNGKNWLIKRGVPVMIPVALKEVIDNSDKAMEAAYSYAREQALKQPN